ncbi:MAG: hypothetical protein AAF676_09175, partial [Pseudomonadota bacterium]
MSLVRSSAVDSGPMPSVASGSTGLVASGCGARSAVRGRVDALVARLPSARRADAEETSALLARLAPKAAQGVWVLAFLNAH